MTIDPKLLEQCVGCGLCLSSCPTFSITHLEQHGPRGRIAGMRAVEDGTFDILDPDYLESMETCVQCRACEEVCPSDVRFGALMEEARTDIERTRRERGVSTGLRGIVQRGLLLTIERRAVLRTLTALLRTAQRIRLDRLLPRRFRIAVPVRPARLGPVAPPGPGTSEQGTVHLFRGCVMDAWFGGVHEASVEVLTAAGRTVDASRVGLCCGALHVHAGRADRAAELARITIDAYADTEGPIVVNSAGCGAAMKEYGHLVGTPEAERFAARVKDLSECVEPGALPMGAAAEERRVAWQAPCHLRYVQQVDDAGRALLEAVPGTTVVEGADRQLCCGAGGAYSVLEPEFSGALRDRKCDALRATGCDVVVTANPGCAMQLAAGGMQVEHLADALARAIEQR